MSPKGKNPSNASSSMKKVDKNVFASDDANKRYTDNSNRKEIVVEHGFNFEHKWSHLNLMNQVKEMIEKQNWATFFCIPSVQLTKFVREFYANVLEHDNGIILVRGEKANCSQNALNSYLNPSSILEDDYSR
ncbi:hypothetical protein ACH5RR_012635 [Cinchona calisaya]|uniref:Uncharacterized protein n=1 Tax=Cinchona calisaya TaxID=153742 RepID=A0ABD3A8D6_9GENT